MKDNILAKIIVILAILLIVGIGLYYKYSYPLSQAQLQADFKTIIAMPIEHYYNATEDSCGIFYSRQTADDTTSGRSNNKALNCLQKKFDVCQTSNLLTVIDESTTDKKSITYSLLRVLRANDQGECIIQNYYEKQRWDSQNNQIDPVFFINTCTSLSAPEYKSCKPDYIHEMN